MMKPAMDFITGCLLRGLPHEGDRSVAFTLVAPGGEKHAIEAHRVTAPVEEGHLDVEAIDSTTLEFPFQPGIEKKDPEPLAQQIP